MRKLSLSFALLWASSVFAQTTGLPLKPQASDPCTGTMTCFYALSSDGLGRYRVSGGTSYKLALELTAPTFTTLSLTTGTSAYLDLGAGQDAAVSASSRARLRYNASTDKLEVSKNGAAYAEVGAGGGLTIGNAVTGGSAGAVLYEDASQNLAALAAGAANTVLIGGATPSYSGSPTLSGDLTVNGLTESVGGFYASGSSGWGFEFEGELNGSYRTGFAVGGAGPLFGTKTESAGVRVLAVGSLAAGDQVAKVEMWAADSDITAGELVGTWAKSGLTMASGKTLGIGDGTEALPGLRFSSDTNTGIWRSGADSLSISTGGVQRIIVTDDGSQISDSAGNSFTVDAVQGIIASAASQIELSVGGGGSIIASSTGVALSGGTSVSVNRPTLLSSEDAVNNATTNILTLTHSTTGSPAAGIGAGLLFRAEDSAGTNESTASIEGILTNVTDGAEASALVVKTRTGGAAPAEAWRVNSTGITIPTGRTLVAGATTLISGDQLVTAQLASLGSSEGDVLTITGGVPTWEAPAGGGAPDDAAYLTNGAVAGLSAEVNVQALTSGQLVLTGPGSGTPIVTQFRPRSDVDEVIGIHGGAAGALLIAASNVAYNAVKPLVFNVSMMQWQIASALEMQLDANQLIPVDLGLALGGVSNRWNGIYNGSFAESSEIATPAAPGADKMRLYAKDNGAGKTQACVIFSSGAEQCFATQP